MATAPPLLIDTLAANKPRWISPGSFKDRIGAMKIMAIAASTHPVCIGTKEMISGRNYIDLDRPDVYGLLMLLVANGLPEVNAALPGSGPLTVNDVARIINDPILPTELP